MKIVYFLVSILVISTASCAFLETQVQFLIKNSAIHNVHGNVMIHIVQLFATLCANLLSATQAVPNQKTQFAMLNARNLSVKLNAQIKDAKCSIAQNV